MDRNESTDAEHVPSIPLIIPRPDMMKHFSANAHTLKEWEKLGLLPFSITPNRLAYRRDEVLAFLDRLSKTDVFVDRKNWDRPMRQQRRARRAQQAESAEV